MPEAIGVQKQNRTLHEHDHDNVATPKPTPAVCTNTNRGCARNSSSTVSQYAVAFMQNTKETDCWCLFTYGVLCRHEHRIGEVLHSVCMHEYVKTAFQAARTSTKARKTGPPNIREHGMTVMACLECF